MAGAVFPSRAAMRGFRAAARPSAGPSRHAGRAVRASSVRASLVRVPGPSVSGPARPAMAPVGGEVRA